jgi:hypothetical protein
LKEVVMTRPIIASLIALICLLGFVRVAVGKGAAADKGHAALGASCKTRSDCQASGATCMRVEGANMCTMPCSRSCDSGFSCVVMTVQPKGSMKSVRGYCLPDEIAAQYGQAITR